jgi:magnesium-transporting ATPase (P-type)
VRTSLHRSLLSVGRALETRSVSTRRHWELMRVLNTERRLQVDVCCFDKTGTLTEDEMVRGASSRRTRKRL